MTRLIKNLRLKGLAHPPLFVEDSVQYLTLMGSVAYGVSGDSSDSDVYGFCIPPKTMIFPHLSGEILGFGNQIKRFEQWQEHHIKDEEVKKEYDFSIYSIIKYFQLCMENNPNMIDSLFTPQFCVLHSNRIGNLVRENRKIFLHKGSWHKFKGYAYSQLHKMSIKTPVEGSKRAANVKEVGFDSKFAYHICRLMDEVEQILTIGDIDLQRSKEYMKAIRRGEVSEEEIRNFFTTKEKTLELAYQNSSLPYSPEEGKVKELLLQCLEEHFGTLEKSYVDPDAAIKALKQIQEICEKNIK